MSTYASSRAVAKPAEYDRVLVGGVDVTYFRGAETVIGDMQLMESYAYGPTTLSFPRIAGDLEQMGVGDLAWCRDGAFVEVQRVDDPTAVSPVVLATDYRGRVADWGTSGRDFTVEVGGEASYPLSLRNMQNPLVRFVRDTGFWAANILETIGLHIADRDGPTTGIEIPISAGSETMESWGLTVGAWSQDANGIQRAIMPTVWGGTTWAFEPKDMTTKHVTLFTDDARVVPRLKRNLPDQSNTFYGNGIDPDGVRLRNSKYPHIIQGAAPEFPGDMTVGDVDADTTTGDGVTVLNDWLVGSGLLAITQSFVYGTYTTRTATAVRTIQDNRGLSITGNVNSATWDAIFDLDASGYSVSEARIDPYVIAKAVRQFDYTGTGAIAGINPDHDASVLRKERNVDFGSGSTEEQMIAFLAGQQARSAGVHWSGEIELNGGFGGFEGEWAAGSAPTGEDVISQLDIRPGMNAWLPMFDGGTLVHISGARVNRQSRTVVLDVDTQARDLLELAALKERKAQAARNIRREWFAENRASKPSGNMVSRDKLFGVLKQKIALPGDTWTVFPMIFGQQGQVNKSFLSTTGSAAAFAFSVFSFEITEARLNHRIGNPLATPGSEAWYETGWAADLLLNRKMLFAAGTDEEPCGYWPKKHTNTRTGETTGNPITGEHLDTASWPYIQSAATPMVVWVAVYPDRDTHLRKGVLFWAQEDDAV